MATENKPVTAYLPEDVLTELTRYCIENGITRKNQEGELKPVMGTGIVEVLKIFFLLNNIPNSVPSHVLTQSDLDNVLTAIKDEVDKLRKEVNQIKEAIPF